MPDLHLKQEMVDRSSPTVPNTSRAQTISSTAPSPAQLPSQVTDDSDATMSGLDHGEASLPRDEMLFLGVDSCRLIQSVKDLEALNINTTLQLPKFVVVGDQSAGKSSIVEALCDISLPRSLGTCTRCPFLITTSSQVPPNGDAWACTISIQQNHYFEGPSDSGTFQPLGQNVVTHFATVTDKNELEPMLRKAQLAILNPRDDPKSFVDIDLASISLPRQVPFSPNVVSLEIQGPDLPELYFYDLPGSINVIEDNENPALVKMIEKLITTYINDEKCLILLACGADQDVETSTTFRFIKDCHATQRCVGVLTKADLLPPGKLDYIQQILSGRKFTLGKGWFITKQLCQKQIDQGVSHTMARELEAAFFRQNMWAALDKMQHCFGIGRVQEIVSRSMTDHIRGELPEILGRIKVRCKAVSTELTSFPESPPHPTFAITRDIQRLASKVSSHIEGDRDVNLFRDQWLKVMVKFRENLSDMKPSVSLKTPGYKTPPIVVDDDDDGTEPSTPTPVRFAIRPSMTPRPGTSNPRRHDLTPSSSRKRPAEITPQQRIKTDPSTPSMAAPLKLTLETLRAQYERGSTSAVPGSVNAKVTDRLILESLSSWDVAMNRLLKDATEILTKLITQSIDNVLSNLQLTGFYIHTKEELAAFVARLLHEEGDRTRYLLSCQQVKPMITHVDWKTMCNARTQGLQSQRNLQRVNEHFDTIEAAAVIKAKITPTEKRAEKANDAAWLSQTLGTDDWATEINSLAIIMCYYEIAVMCFVDAVAKSFDFGVLRPLQKDIAETLFGALHANDPKVCAELLAEDPDRERQRVALLSEKEKLEKALASIGELQN